MRERLSALITHLKTEHTEPERLGLAVGLGILVGVLPLYGLHTVLCIAFAVLLRLNKATMLLASQISMPLVAPLLVAAGLVIGEGLRFGTLRRMDLADARDFLGGMQLLAGDLPDRFLSCLLGDAVLGVILGGVAGLATWLWARRRFIDRSGDQGPDG